MSDTKPVELSTEELLEAARQIRLSVLDEIHQAGSGHPGGSLSCADILAVLFKYVVRPGPSFYDDPHRDRIILSKGHAAPALYAALALVGAIDEGELGTLRQLGSRLQGHPDVTRLPAVEMSTGSLGQGLSVGVGIAWSARRKRNGARSFVIVGDGELDSGQVWEAIALAGVQKLANLIVVVDANGIQNDGPVPSILDITPYTAKVEAFRWSVKEVQGHDVEALRSAFDWATGDEPGDHPRMVVAHTVKGRGVSFMEGRPEWHSHSLTDEQYRAAVSEVTRG